MLWGLPVADVGLLSVVARDAEHGKSDNSIDSTDPVSRIVVSPRCYGVLFDDVTYEVQWSPMSRMRWGPWLRTVARCSFPGRASRRILNNITGFIRPGELYVAHCALCTSCLLSPLPHGLQVVYGCCGSGWSS